MVDGGVIPAAGGGGSAFGDVVVGLRWKLDDHVAVVMGSFKLAGGVEIDG